MGLLNSSLSNLLGGVSQQADSLRGASNCEEQTNAYPSPVNGLVKRPPTQFMTDALGATFQDANALDTSSHLINRDSSERYLLTISGKNVGGSDAALSVWDLENNEAKTVYYDTDAISYLNATDHTTAFSFSTAGDVTYISNTEVTPLMDLAVSPEAVEEGLVHVRQGALDTEYNIELNGITSSEITAASGATEVRTNVIASKLNAILSGGSTSVTDNSLTLGWDGDVSSQSGSNTFSKGSAVYKSVIWTLDAATQTSLQNAVGLDLINKTVQITIGQSNWGAAYKDGQRVETKYFNTGTVLYVHSHAADYSTIVLKTEINGGTDTILSRYPDSFAAGSGTGGIKINYTTSSLHDGFTFIQKDSTILMTNTEGTAFTLSTTDSVGDTYLKSFLKETQYFSDLPAYCYDGFSIQVSGSAESLIDDYYVEFKTSDGSSFGEGTWNERSGFGINVAYNSSTMPHLLIRQTDGTFLFKPADGRTTPSNVTAGYEPPTVETLTCSAVGAYVLNDVVYTLDGLDPSKKIPVGSRLVNTSIGGVGELIVVEGTADATGTVTVTTESTMGGFPDNEPFTINLTANYDSYVWEDRKAGDDTTNPLPNFIGNPINDIFFYENRLGMLSGESVTLSESGQFFNFFRTTVIDLLDTAPIEVVGSSNSVNTLRHAVSFNGNLLLFGDNTQFMLGSGREGLSPKTVAMSQVSNYECDPNCAPVIGGTSVFFAYPRGNYGGLQDMVIRDSEARDLQAFDLTDSVPSYIENPFRDIATMPQENLVIGLPKAEGGDMQDLYLYKYLDRGNERIQSAWFKFSLTSQGITADTQQIIGIHTVENTLYVLSRFVDADTPTKSHTSIHKIEFTTEGITDLFSQPPLLDNLVSSTSATGVVTAAVVGDDTVFTLPYGSLGKTASDFQVITKHKTGSDGGVVLPILSGTFTDAESTTITVDGDKTAEHVWIGMKYDMTYKYASPIFKGPSSGGGASLVTSGRYQIHSADIVYHDTNTFNVAVSVEGRSDYSYTFTADTTQVDVDTEGSVGLGSGDMRIPIHAKNDTYDMTITSDSAYPVKLLSTEFEAQYNTRSRRMGI